MSLTISQVFYVKAIYKLVQKSGTPIGLVVLLPGEPDIRVLGNWGC